MSGLRRLGALVVVLAGLVAGCGGPSGGPAGTPAARSRAVRASPDPLGSFRSVRSYDAPPPPIRLRIPTIGVASRVERIGRLADGGLASPHAWDAAGWYDQGPRPGQTGPAVILGHVDSTAGPAVFYRLPTLRPGDSVLVDLAPGASLMFRVDKVARYPKDHFPTEAVYFPTLDRELRLITCGGSFDRAVGHYRDNIVVYATLAGQP